MIKGASLEFFTERWTLHFKPKFISDKVDIELIINLIHMYFN